MTRIGRFAYSGFGFGLALLCGGGLLGAQTEHSLFETGSVEPRAHFVLRLHGGDYEITSSTDDRVHISENHEGTRPTAVKWHPQGSESRLEIDPPTGSNGPHIVIALPSCEALDLRLTAGELVFHAVPCHETEASLHAGELQAEIGDGQQYRFLRASVSIGEVDAPGLGASGADVNKGGFFRSFVRSGSGQRSFTAHVGSGQITLRTSQQ